MKYALFEHNHTLHGVGNYGDHIQSLAAKQFLPHVDFYVERDKLNKDYDRAKIIMNGWFTYAPENWPPNDNLEPLFVSFHLNPSVAHKILNKKENRDYLKKYAPIGCRDYKTLEILKSYDIEAYFSSCLTTTLDLEYKTEEKTNDIYFADVLYNYDERFLYKASPIKFFYHLITGKVFKHLNIPKKNAILRRLIPKNVIDSAIDINHLYRSNMNTDEIYVLADETLRKYSTAKLVVTSRIHCALPCLAMGTPVLFILDSLLDEVQDMSRFRGILDHMNLLTTYSKDYVQQLFGREMNVLAPNEIDWDNPPSNPDSFRVKAEELKKRCRDFINETEN